MNGCNEALNRWFSFLEQDISKERLEELVEMDPAIKMAEEKLERLSSDPDTLALYRAREDSAHERANLISTGLQRGIEQGKIEIAINLLDILDDQTISQKTGISLEAVKKLRAAHQLSE